MWDTIIDRLSAAFEPLLHTVIAVGTVLGLAKAGTMLFGFLLFVAALEALRSSTGLYALGARLMALVAVAIISATSMYGDFLVPPTKAAIALITARLDAKPDSALLATLGFVGVGAAYKAGQSRVATRANTRRTHTRFRPGLSRTFFAPPHRQESNPALTMAPAERIQLRQITPNPRKAVARIVRSSRTLGPGRNWG